MEEKMADDEKKPKIIDYNRNGKASKAIDIEDLASLMVAMEDKLQMLGLGFLLYNKDVVQSMTFDNWQNLKAFLYAQLQDKEDKKK